jgi:hypothetical protein
MSIMRQWRAEIRRTLKDEYAAHVKATGIGISRARYYPKDDRYLMTRPETIQHYDSTAP